MAAENPGQGATWTGAGIRYAEQLSSIRTSAERQAQQRLRRQHLAGQIYRLGARALFEFLDEIARHHRLGEDIDRRLEKFASIDPALLSAVGGDRFAPAPMRLVGGGP
jgi:hypothetical protein